MLCDRVRTGVPARELTTIGCGGPLGWLWPVQFAQDARNALLFAQQQGVPVTILGGGSNLLVGDEGFAGVVLQPVAPAVGIEVVDVTAERARLRIWAGVAWTDVVDFAVARGWQGIECLAGIPGQAGAAPIQNIGAYGQEVAETVAQVLALDMASGQTVAMLPADCRFAYRDSLFKQNPGRWLVLGVDLWLRVGAPPCLAYAQLREAFEGAPQPTLAEVREAVLALRRHKSMVIDPADPDSRSCGSFFTNPIVELEAAAGAGALAQQGETMPQWPQADGRVKLSAAWLIERCGFHKGYGDGRVGLSRAHTLAIVNRGGATAGEVMAFSEAIRAQVRAKTGVDLQREAVTLGVDSLQCQKPNPSAELL